MLFKSGKSTGTNSRAHSPLEEDWNYGRQRLIMSQREQMFQTSVATEVKATYSETPPTFQGTPHLSIVLNNSSAFSDRRNKMSTQCPWDCSSPVCNLGSICGGNVALTSCDCGSHHQKIAITVWWRKESFNCILLSSSKYGWKRNTDGSATYSDMMVSLSPMVMVSSVFPNVG